MLCQIHADFSRQALGLAPAAAIGMSSGETNALFAFGVWWEMAQMLEDVAASGIYGVELSAAP